MSIQSQTNPNWRKSSYSVGGSSSNCVELAKTANGVLVRNSKRPDGEMITFTSSELGAFIAGCQAGEFDDLA